MGEMEQGLHVDRQEELPTEAHEQGVPVVDIQEDEPGVVRSKSKRKLLKAVGKAAGPVLLAVGLATGGVGGVTPAEAGRPDGPNGPAGWRRHSYGQHFLGSLG